MAAAASVQETPAGPVASSFGWYCWPPTGPTVPTIACRCHARWGRGPEASTGREKTAALARQERDLTTRVLAHSAQISSFKEQVLGRNTLLGHWQQLAIFDSFNELDWKPLVGAIEQLEREQCALERSSDVLRTLQHQFTELSAAQEATEAAMNETTVAHATATEKLVQAAQAHDACITSIAGLAHRGARSTQPDGGVVRAPRAGHARLSSRAHRWRRQYRLFARPHHPRHAGLHQGMAA